jgi:DNA polymerase I-like protein with 3'-5' exonuclease and polymerase domains
MYDDQIEWLAPDNFPDLSKYKTISIDLETRDPDLRSKGSGAIIGNGEIIGVAVAVDGWCKYYPFGHEGGGNLDKKKILNWISDVCATEATKVFHNAMYDVCWLRSYGVHINGCIRDTMVMASLVNENRVSYTLNALSWEYLRKRKNESILNEAAKSWGIDPKAELYKLPAMKVGVYAEKDAQLTLELFERLTSKINEENLNEICDLETELFPCLVDMRFKGVRVNVEKAHKLKEKLFAQEKVLLQEIKKETQIDVQIWAARSIAKVFDKLNVSYKKTLITQSPSFTKNFLATCSHPLIKKISRAREINKARTTFIDTIIKYEHKGRIHADINQIRSDQGGTVTGRFSYSNPNLQQIPARDKELGPLIRSLFIPEDKCKWGCFDYNQQEPRLVAHFAAITPNVKENPSVREIIDSYSKNDIDFHKVVAEMAGIDRIQAKTINLGLFYGMGKTKLQAELGLSTKQEAETLFEQYHDRVPFVKDLMEEISRWASTEGEIRTLLKRGCRFDKWEPTNKQWNRKTMRFEVPKKIYNKEKSDKAKESVYDVVYEPVPILSEEEAKFRHKAYLTDLTNGFKGITFKEMFRRAFTYKALNKLIQGSAADMTKKSMLDLYKEGVIAHIQIHDELDISVESDKEAKRIIEIMESSVSLKVPNRIDYRSGKTWGDIYN